MARHKKHLGLGIVLLISFFGVLVLIFSPVFPGGNNGLDFSDMMFNRLSKGSSFFIPKLTEQNKEFIGKTFSVSIDMKTPEDAENTAKLFTTAGATAVVKGSELKIEGDLGKTLEAVLHDSEAMYQNEGEKVSGLYGYDEKKVMENWHGALVQIDKIFKKGKLIPESNMVSDVKKKAVETAYNFYGVVPEKVSEKFGIMTFLLVFYVVYTLWYGFAIFYIFEGVGLTMTKSKVKSEV
jgi:hypothetical protein